MRMCKDDEFVSAATSALPVGSTSDVVQARGHCDNEEDSAADRAGNNSCHIVGFV